MMSPTLFSDSDVFHGDSLEFVIKGGAFVLTRNKEGARGFSGGSFDTIEAYRTPGHERELP